MSTEWSGARPRDAQGSRATYVETDIRFWLENVEALSPLA